MAAEQLSIEAIQAFQASHKNHLGKPLRIDGDLGPQTRWAMDVETLCPERRAFIRAVQQYLDLVEVPIGSNDDPRGIIRGWLKMCGAKPGDPWCAAKMSHCLSLALSRPIRSAGALALARSFPETREPIAGDLAWFATEGGRGHIFAVFGVTPPGAEPREVMGGEGNCNNRSCVTRRPFDELRFSRIIDDVSGRCPGVITKDIPLILRNSSRTR